MVVVEAWEAAPAADDEARPACSPAATFAEAFEFTDGDAMGDQGTFEGTYVGMVTHNINTIVEALKKR